MLQPTSPARISLPVTWGRYRLEVSSDDPQRPRDLARRFDAGFYAEASADTPDLLEIALDKPEYASGRHHYVAVTARTAGGVTLNVVGDRLLTHHDRGRAGRRQCKIPLTVGKDWGTGAYVVATLAPSAGRKRRSRMPGRAIGLQWFSIDKKRAHARRRHAAAER